MLRVLFLFLWECFAAAGEETKPFLNISPPLRGVPEGEGLEVPDPPVGRKVVLL